MAKKINNTEDAPQGEVQSVAVETTGQDKTAEAKDTSAQEPEKVETKTDETATEKQEEETKETSREKTQSDGTDSEVATNPHILDMLKKFPAYESLYIDSHGGTFSPDTPAAIRRDAVLYKNPFYNELKRQS